jgi:hypothetical protein
MNLTNPQWLLFYLMLSTTSCRPTLQSEKLIFTLIAVPAESVVLHIRINHVAQFLQDSKLELGDLDRVNPQPYTQLTNGMIVTVVRVQESTVCEESEIPDSTQSILNEGLQPSEERFGQGGSNGTEQARHRPPLRMEFPNPVSR